MGLSSLTSARCRKIRTTLSAKVIVRTTTCRTVAIQSMLFTYARTTPPFFFGSHTPLHRHELEALIFPTRRRMCRLFFCF